MFPREYRRALQEMAEEEAKKVAENEMINGGVDGDEEDDEEEVINEARGWLMRLGGARETERLLCIGLLLRRTAGETKR